MPAKTGITAKEAKDNFVECGGKPERDTALDVSHRKQIQSAVAASLCRRTP